MTPARTGGKTGNFEIQERFKNVGEIRRSLGTSVLKEFNNRRALLRKLEKAEKYEILRAFRDKKLTIEQLIEADANERLGATLSDAMLHMNLWDSVEQALAKIRKSHATVERYRISMKALQMKAADELPDDATLADLASVDWDALSSSWGASGADWMHVKRAVSKVTGTILEDKYHPFVRKLRQAIPNQKVKKRRPRITPSIFLAITAKAPVHAQRVFWALLITGLRDRVEYLRLKPEHLDHATRTIDITKSKNEQSESPVMISPRLWQRVVEAVPSPLSYGRLMIHWKRACVAAGYAHYEPSPRFKSKLKYVGPTLHDLRHAHGQWAIDEGVEQSKVQSSLRHENPGQTLDYISYNATGEVSDALANVIERSTKPKGKGRKKA
jgi:integrase